MVLCLHFRMRVKKMYYYACTSACFIHNSFEEFRYIIISFEESKVYIYISKYIDSSEEFQYYILIWPDVPVVFSFSTSWTCQSCTVHLLHSEVWPLQALMYGTPGWVSQCWDHFLKMFFFTTHFETDWDGDCIDWHISFKCVNSFTLDVFFPWTPQRSH